MTTQMTTQHMTTQHMTTQEELKRSNISFHHDREQIFQQISLVERTCLQSLLNKHYITELEKVKSTHGKKLLNL